jgi:tetratricopeptide (TPR) repeat protein
LRGEPAVAAYERALAIEPASSDAWIGMGGALAGLGRIDEALAAYDRAISFDPRSKAWVHKVYLFEDLQRWGDVVAAAERALAIYPADLFCWIRKGGALLELGRAEEAIQAIDRALALEPINRWAWGVRADSLRALGRWEEMLVAARRCSYDDYRVGVALSALGRSREALEAFDTTLKNVATHGKAWIAKAALLEKLDRLDTALLAYDHAIEIPEVEELARSRQQALKRRIASRRPYSPIDRYEIKELFNRAFGDVYRAYDRETRREVALKEVVYAVDPELFARFRAKGYFDLRHLYIATAYDFAGGSRNFYLVRELVEGKTLKQMLVEEAPFTVPERKLMLFKIALGLQYAHDQGLIHGSINPYNVMVLADGTIKIVDFGIDLLKRQKFPPGFPDLIPYMAPELIIGGEAGEATDLFAFGAVGYQLMTGRHPFAGASIEEVVNLVLHVEPAPIQGYNPDCPESLERVIHRALAKRREQRYQTFHELFKDW